MYTLYNYYIYTREKLGNLKIKTKNVWLWNTRSDWLASSEYRSDWLPLVRVYLLASQSERVKTIRVSILRVSFWLAGVIS